MEKKLKTRMAGALLRSFTTGHLSDDAARAMGYDPDAVRDYHRILKPKKRARSRGQGGVR
jgi:hypothetical protein